MDIPFRNGPLTEQQLRYISKSFGSLSKKNEDLSNQEYRHLESVLSQVLHTANLPNLSVTHGTAALNALSSFLEQGMVASDSRLRELCFAESTWMTLMHVFLYRSQKNKSKPVKQILNTIIKLLLETPQSSVRIVLLKHVMFTGVAVLRGESDFATAKPTFQLLLHLLNKNIINALQLLEQFVEKKDFPDVSVGTISEGPQEKRLATRAISPQLVNDYTLCMLEWLQYPDISPLIGRLVLSFFRSLQACHDEADTIQHPDNREVPLWALPIKKVAASQTSLIEALEMHVLPGLLRLNPTDTQNFVDSLPSIDVFISNLGKHSISDLRLCLQVWKIKLEMGTNMVEDNQFIEKLLIAALRLTPHSSAGVRMSALDLVIFSLISSKFFSSSSVRHLERVLPLFHEEIDPKIRNDFISCVKRFSTEVEHCSRDSSSIHILPNSIQQEFIPLQSIFLGNSFETVQIIYPDFVSFTLWYNLFLLNELQPTITYQRHIIALRILESSFLQRISRQMSKSGSNPHTKIVKDPLAHGHSEIYGLLLVRLLTDLIMDPFDDIRQIAASIIRLMPWDMCPWNNLSEPRATRLLAGEVSSPMADHTYNGYIFRALSQAESLSRLTGRADHADSVGRLYSLLFDSCKDERDLKLWSNSAWSIVRHLLLSLQHDTNCARKDLRWAVAHAPLHGALIALRHIVISDCFKQLAASDVSNVDIWTNVSEQTTSYCSYVWEAVKEVLCFDAPEGHESGEADDRDLDIGAKDTLSFSWRALKESSSLMNAMILGLSHDSKIGSESRYNLLRRVGYLSFTQLAELRHRGAFSTVSQTFASCCAQCRGTLDDEAQQGRIQNLPRQWYQDALSTINLKATSLTRRSAGIPDLISGILVAFPSGDFPTKVILHLQEVAKTPIAIGATREDLSLPQVHALNCLKEIFTDSRLEPVSGSLTASTLDIAVSCLENYVWAIRNCGLMLFRALLSRLNGGKDAASTKESSTRQRFSSLAYETYPNLSYIVLRLLTNDTGDIPDDYPKVTSMLRIERVFPALEIIERLGLPSTYRDKILQSIYCHIEGSDWATRAKAANALAITTRSEDSLANVVQTFELHCFHWRSHNALHGWLLTVRSMIACMRSLKIEDLQLLMSTLYSSLEHWDINDGCPIITATYVNIAADILVLAVNHQGDIARTLFSNLRERLRVWSTTVAIRSLDCPSIALLNEASKRFFDVYTNSPSPMTEGIAYLITPAKSNDSSLIQVLNSDTVLEQAVGNWDSELSPVQMAHQQEFVNGREKSVSGTVHPDFEADEKVFKNDSYDISLSDLERHMNYTSNSPQCAETNLRLSGKFAALSLNYCGSLNCESVFSSWICRLSLAVDDCSEFCTKQAAMSSIGNFLDLVEFRKYQNWYSPPLLGLYIILYDILVDDDEIIRNQGADLTANLLSLMHKHATVDYSDIPLMPVAAGGKLIRILADNYSKSALLVAESIHRITGAKSLLKLGATTPSAHVKDSQDGELVTSEERTVDQGPQLHLGSAGDLVHAAIHQDNSLFAEEKQNLYINPVQDVQRWTQILLGSHSSSWTPYLICSFYKWTMQGLRALHVENRNRYDGPLGWTSKPEVYLLGIRILAAAKVIIRRKAISQSERLQLISLLMTLRETGGTKMLHESWLRLIEEILFYLEAGSS